MLVLLALACDVAPSKGVDSVPEVIERSDLCDGRDDDLDGEIDEDSPEGRSLWYRDVDSDGFGGEDDAVEACAAPPNRVELGGDCDDGRSAVNPGAVERCNDLDDDCDGVVDGEGAEGWGAWLPDVDGDGYGDAAAEPVGGCERPSEGYVGEGGDCDDADPSLHPGAVELCNGVDDDCDPSSGEEGAALFVSADGEVEDWTALLAGAARAPLTHVVTAPGTLRLCEGTRYASLRVRADLRVEGLGDAAQVVLSGGDAEGVVIVRTDGVQLELADLTLAGGAGVGAVLGEYTAGGALECDAQATVVADNLILRDSAAGVGGGLFIRGCDVTLRDSSVLSNEAAHYGGGVAVLDGALTLERALIQGNEARYGAGLAVVGLDTSPAVSLLDSLVALNEASREGGGAILEGATLSCQGDASVRAGFLQNDAERGGGVLVGADSALLSAGCDWGVGAEGNSPEDVSLDTAADWGDDATFTCDDEGCTP